MELELKKERFSCYRALPPLCGTQEETAETILPDYLPDVTRLVESSGCLLLHGCESAEGRVRVSGQLRVSVLYTAEEAQSLRAFVYSLPFEHTMDGRLPDGTTEVCLEGQLCACDVRPVNPRKLFTRAGIQLTLTPYTPCTLTVCSGVEDAEAHGIETLCETRELPMIRALREKDFTFSDELLLSGAKEPARELLRTRCTLRLTDQRLLGGKLAIKGLAQLEVLYLDAAGESARVSGELPFSQVLDGLEEDGGRLTARTVLRLSGIEARIGSESEPDDNRTVSLRLSISAFAVLSERKSVCCVTDLYSTRCELSARSETVELAGEGEYLTRELPVRERLETGAEVKSVLSAEVRFQDAGVSGSGEDAEVRVAASLRVLYLDENGTPLLSERRVELLLRTALPEGTQVSVHSICAGEISASGGLEGVELRFPVFFTLCAANAPCYPCLTSLQTEERGDERANTPSLVLRAVKRDERLWDIAKQYRTTVSAILAANELSADAPAAAGTLLLIPRCR